MFYSLPSNIIPFFLLGISILLFGIRGIYLYNKQKTPLILYYATGAVLGGISALMYSVPFFFTQNEEYLKLTTIVGDVFYFGSILVMVRLIWYLGFNKKIAFIWILLPYLVMIIGAFVATLIAFPDIQYTFSEGSVSYPVPVIASWFFAAMSSAYIFVGILTLKSGRSIGNSKQRLRLMLIGASFLIGGIFATYNFLFTQGSNSSLISTVGYLISAIILFIGIFIVSRKK
ncbi:MAG TPA: hypothetical protein PJ993_02550 [Candidatus Saccharibacteria bacterium]|nr:hypothetical protein [Candidatus Saccharibacteria bacterium]HMT39785.1 hypothetical protein [Candidatus Saccharibacteria bacterium]